MSGLLSAFRKKYGCHHVLTRLVEDCKQALDKHMHVGLLLLDLSKAFDCLPHKLLLCKLHAYGASRDACDLLCSFLTNRPQRVKISNVKSDMLFNVFINDLTYVVQNTCPLYNYADDNTLGFWHNRLDDLRLNFEYGSKIAIEWFQENHMKVNVSKFQSIVLKPKGVIPDVEFRVSGHSLKPVSCVKLLGVKIDERLTFDDHISVLCAKASHQISALCRIVKYLTMDNRMSIYNAFIASNFNYCNMVWHFCSNRSLYKLEKVHKQALRVVLNDYSSSYHNLLDKVSKPTLYVSRLKAIAIEAYRCKANENPDHINVMLNPLIKPYNLRGGPHAEQPRVNTTSCGLNSFTYQVAKLWNEIPSSIKDDNSLLHFKSLLSKWAGPECHCGSCILCKVYDV